MTQEPQHSTDPTQPLPHIPQTSELPADPTEEEPAAQSSSAEEPHDESVHEGAQDDGDEAVDELYDDEESTVPGFIHLRKPIFAVGATIAGLLILALLAGNIYQFIHNSNNQVVATVNGAPITQKEFNRADSNSSQVLDTLIADKLVDQEAKKDKVVISDNEIDAQIKTIKQELGTQQDYEAALKRNNLTEAELRAQIRTNEEAKQIGAKNVTVTEADAQTYYNQNKAQFGTQTYAQAKPQIMSQLLQTKQSDAINTWIAGLRKSAKVEIHLPT